VNEPFVTRRLTRQHDRSSFACGVEELDQYFQRQACQDQDRHLASVFVLVEEESGEIAGFYTLNSSSINASDFPEPFTRKLPRYPLLPTILIGRLAVDRRFHGQGIGGLLINDAFRRAMTAAEEVAALAVIVDAKGDQAITFYEHYGFRALENAPNRLFLPMTTIRKLLSQK
jgi:GNAT superfamily N-acetyltransferase